jgi:hypothetical protein
MAGTAARLPTERASRGAAGVAGHIVEHAALRAVQLSKVKNGVIVCQNGSAFFSPGAVDACHWELPAESRRP